MNKKKVFTVFAIIGLIFLIFSTIVIIAFNAVRNDPIDKIAMTYIWNTKEISDEFGEIVSVGRNIVEKSEKSETVMIIPYSVDTKSNRVLILIKLEKNENDWRVESFEAKEVIKNAY
ncbi:MAG: hypothetical protein RR306_03790 [Clostridia bacterium]